MTKFVAPEVWQYHGNEKTLEGHLGLNMDKVKKTGLSINEGYTTVDRVGVEKDLYCRLPDHLNLPAYDDKFVVLNNANNVREISKNKKSKITLNDLKWECGLRGAYFTSSAKKPNLG